MVNISYNFLFQLLHNSTPLQKKISPFLSSFLQLKKLEADKRICTYSDRSLHKTLKSLWTYFFIIKKSQRRAIRRQQILHHFIINLQCRNFQHKVSIWVLCIQDSFCEELVQDIQLYASNFYFLNHFLNTHQAQRLSCWKDTRKSLATWIAS